MADTPLLPDVEADELTPVEGITGYAASLVHLDTQTAGQKELAKTMLDRGGCIGSLEIEVFLENDSS
jgi:hypothetical protein